MEINKISLSADDLQVDRIPLDKFFKSPEAFEIAKLSAENSVLKARLQQVQSDKSQVSAILFKREEHIIELEAEVERLRCEKYPWRHVPGVTCEQPGKMRIEENHGD